MPFLSPSPHPARAPARPHARAGWRLLAITTVALLAACGGGSDGGSDDGGAVPGGTVVGPPTVAATLVNTTGEAQQSAAALVTGADVALQRSSAMNAFSAFLGAPVIPLAVAPAGHKTTLAVPTVHALAAQTAPCIDLVDAPCSGSATLDTNVPDGTNVLNTGDWVDLQFQSLTGGVFGVQMSFNGHLRMDFLAPFNPDATTTNGLDIKLTFDAVSGSVNGAAFGPVTDAFRLQVNAEGVSTITAGGASFSGLTAVNVSGSGNYNIGGGTVRLGHWSDTSRYVDLSYVNWRVINGRPAAGANASVTAGAGTIALRVVSSTTTTVVYAVTIALGGTTSQYTVTATYPAGGGVPSYLATLTPT